MGFISDWIRNQHPHLIAECDCYVAEVLADLQGYEYCHIFKPPQPQPATTTELQILADAGLDLSLFDV